MTHIKQKFAFAPTDVNVPKGLFRLSKDEMRISLMIFVTILFRQHITLFTNRFGSKRRFGFRSV